MSLGAQAEVVQNVLLHGFQVRVFHLDILSKKNIFGGTYKSRERTNMPF